MSIFTFAQSVFDLYCLYMAMPGSHHTGFYVVSYEFVYVGSPPGELNITGFDFTCGYTSYNI